MKPQSNHGLPGFIHKNPTKPRKTLVDLAAKKKPVKPSKNPLIPGRSYRKPNETRFIGFSESTPGRFQYRRRLLSPEWMARRRDY